MFLPCHVANELPACVIMILFGKLAKYQQLYHMPVSIGQRLLKAEFGGNLNNKKIAERAV